MKSFQKKKISKAKNHFLHYSKGLIPRFCELPKIHKVSVPIWPIVSVINSLTYNLSKFLSRILSSLLVNRYRVRISKEFVDYVQNFTISDNEVLVSFDGVSLFTSAPMDKALGLVLDLLSSNESLASRTSLDIQDITIGLEHFFFFHCISLQKRFFKTKLWHSYGLLHLSYHCFYLHETPFHNISHPAVTLAEIS